MPMFFQFPNWTSFLNIEAITIKSSLSSQQFLTIAWCIKYQEINSLFWKNIQKITFAKGLSAPVPPLSLLQFCCWKIQEGDWDFVSIIKNWMLLQLRIDIRFLWYKRLWIDKVKLTDFQNLMLLPPSKKYEFKKVKNRRPF